MREAVLIYPHQLFEAHPAVQPGRIIYVLEDPLYFSQLKFHKQKLVLHRASMKAYEAHLKSQHYDVRYIDYAILQEQTLDEVLRHDEIQSIHVVDVVDDWLERKITDAVERSSIELHWHETPQFLTSKEDVEAYWKSAQNHLQHNFYIWQRKRLNILVEHGEPAGGKWSFDAENRKKLPADAVVPDQYIKSDSLYIREAQTYVAEHFPDHYGAAETFAYAVTHEEARSRLHQFIQERFRLFGAYEDAISTDHHAMFHSQLSPYLNNGLLTPQEVLNAILAAHVEHEIPLASVEGFVRQLIGWREFMRMVYVCDGRRMRHRNILKATRKLTPAWWEGTTGLLPVDHTITTLQQHAYSHHIIRLMIMGNIMTLLGVDPHDSYKWFMEWYIDAYDWVMVPNVYGMGVFADGPNIVTKPYVSSSNYLRKMSDYPKGEWCEAWDALYWSFVDAHRSIFSSNSRAYFAVTTFERFSRDKQDALRSKAAETFSKMCA